MDSHPIDLSAMFVQTITHEPANSVRLQTTKLSNPMVIGHSQIVVTNATQT